MMELFGKIVFWHWWIVGILLLGIELMLPAQFFLWLGISAGLTGGILLVAPNIGWQWQMVFFGVLSIASIVGWRQYQKKFPTHSDEPMLNRRGSQYVGRTFELSEEMALGRGKINVDDTTWRAECDAVADLPAGSRVKVVDIDGTTLKVEPA